MRKEDDLENLLLKALVVGDVGTNKSALIRRWVHGSFDTAYKGSIGVDFALKRINWSPDRVVRLQLWDIAGQERFGSMTRVYYREAVIAFIVCDLSLPSSFESVQRWKEDLRSKINDPNLTIILLFTNANQYAKDLLKAEEMDSFVKKQGIDKWFAVDSSVSDDQPLHFAVGRYFEKTEPQKPLVESEQKIEKSEGLFERFTNSVRRAFSSSAPALALININNDNNAPLMPAAVNPQPQQVFVQDINKQSAKPASVGVLIQENASPVFSRVKEDKDGIELGEIQEKGPEF